jgi:hypothetical protein
MEMSRLYTVIASTVKCQEQYFLLNTEPFLYFRLLGTKKEQHK